MVKGKLSCGRGSAEWGRTTGSVGLLLVVWAQLSLQFLACAQGDYPSVDFNHPPRSFIVTNAQAWSIWMEQELCADHPILASNALARLGGELAEISRVLPEHSLCLLQERKVFLMLGELSRQGGRNNGADYFQPSAPDHFPKLDPRMASSILIYSASNYVWLSDLWARKVLVHELAHAWQLEQWPEKQETILGAYEHAKEKGLYRQVRGEAGQPVETAYALANQLEYFAELSCMYFNCCDYFPQNRQELQAYDPVGYAMIRQMWRIAAE